MMRAHEVARTLRMAQKAEFLDSLSSKQQGWIRFLLRRILLEQGREPGTLSAEQANLARLAEQGGESIWDGPVRSIAAFDKEKSAEQ